MVGAKGATFLREGYSRAYAPNLLDFIWQVAAQLGYQPYFVPLDGDPIIDDPYYLSVRGRIPMETVAKVSVAGLKPTESKNTYTPQKEKSIPST